MPCAPKNSNGCQCDGRMNNVAILNKNLTIPKSLVFKRYVQLLRKRNRRHRRWRRSETRWIIFDSDLIFLVPDLNKQVFSTSFKVMLIMNTFRDDVIKLVATDANYSASITGHQRFLIVHFSSDMDNSWSDVWLVIRGCFLLLSEERRDRLLRSKSLPKFSSQTHSINILIYSSRH